MFIKGPSQKKSASKDAAKELAIFYELLGQDLSPLIRELNPTENRELIRKIVRESPRARERSAALELLDPNVRQDHELIRGIVARSSYSPRYYQALGMLTRKHDLDFLVKLASDPHGGEKERLVVLSKLDNDMDGNVIAKIAAPGISWYKRSDYHDPAVRIAAIKRLDPIKFRLILEQTAQDPETIKYFPAVAEAARRRLGIRELGAKP